MGLHAVVRASLALLEFVAQELDGTHLLLVVTFRERERPRLPRPLVDAVRRGQRIALQGLDRLAEVTAGNPF